MTYYWELEEELIRYFYFDPTNIIDIQTNNFRHIFCKIIGNCFKYINIIINYFIELQSQKLSC